jgi:broad specificity phosphatase PhoE
VKPRRIWLIRSGEAARSDVGEPVSPRQGDMGLTPKGKIHAARIH